MALSGWLEDIVNLKKDLNEQPLPDIEDQIDDEEYTPSEPGERSEATANGISSTTRNPRAYGISTAVETISRKRSSR